MELVLNLSSLLKRLRSPFIIVGVLALLFSCQSPINTVEDPNFTADGYSLDTLKNTFAEEQPSALGFFVEVSGSMNGFFRSNKATQFKKDVWSIVSNFGGNDVFILSNNGTVSEKCLGSSFRSRMNTGGFVSNKETLVPTMLKSILDRLDYSNNECAVLISDMKYSPESHRDVNVLLTQYQADIRNTIGDYPNLAISLIMAKSDYLAANGSVLSDSSPYYYLILGNDKNVAYMRNRIATLLKDSGNYGDNIEFGFDYKAPSYSFGIPDNAIQFEDQPTFTNYDTDYSDTCTINLQINLSDYRWIIADEESFKESFSIKSNYGSTVSIGSIKIEEDNHFNKEFRRKATATIEIKVSDMSLTSDVIEWSMSHPEFLISHELTEMISATAENDYSGSFSLDKFISGVFNAVQNKWDTTPNRILISKTE